MYLFIALTFIFLLTILFLGEREKKYYIQVIETGFSKSVYIFYYVKYPILGRRKYYIMDGYTESAQNFNTIIEAEEHIDKLLKPTTVKIIDYP